MSDSSAQNKVYAPLTWTRYRRRGGPLRWAADDPLWYIEFAGGFDPCYELWHSGDEAWERLGFYPSLAGAQAAAEEVRRAA